MSYTPSVVPIDPKDIPVFLSRELATIAQAYQLQVPFIQLQTLFAPPTKPREGMVVKADGTLWNPGAGAGFYGFKTSAWAFLG